MKIEKQNPGFAKRVKSWLTGKYVENGSTASQNIPAGKWVTWKGQVCKAKTAITMGDTLSSTNLATDEEGALNKMQAGTETGSRTAVGDYTIQINFPESFASAPIVIFTIETGVIRSGEVWVAKNITTTGFEIQWFNPNSDMGTYTVHWIAIKE